MSEPNSLELEPEVINQRDANNKANENISEKYDVDIFTDDSTIKINDNDLIEKTIYSNNEIYELDTVQYLIEPYFNDIQEYPQNVDVSMEEIGNKVLMIVIFIQLLVIFYFIILFIKKRRRKNEDIHNKLQRMGT